MLIHKTMQMPTSCLSCWIAPTCEVWVREKSKYKGYDERLDECPLEEVVRCKDCKHNYHNMIPSGEAEHGCTKCVELPIKADFYCAWGERGEDEID